MHHQQPVIFVHYKAVERDVGWR